MPGREIYVELAVGGIADLGGGIFSGERSQSRGRCEDESLIGRFIVTGSCRPGARLWHDSRAAIEKFDYIGYVEDVLIESGKEENFVALQRTADCASHLLLAIVRAKSQKRVGCSQRTVAKIIESRSVQVI